MIRWLEHKLGRVKGCTLWWHFNSLALIIKPGMLTQFKGNVGRLEWNLIRVWSSYMRLADEIPTPLLCETHNSYLLTMLLDPQPFNTSHSQNICYDRAAIPVLQLQPGEEYRRAAAQRGLLQLPLCIQLTLTYHTAGCPGWGVVVVVVEGLVLLRQGEEEALRPH